MNELSALEGVFTSGQAARLGITAKALSQAVASGRAERIAHGAYRLAGVPTTERDRVAAIWKLTATAKFTHERMAAWDGIVVGGTSAANILGIGDFWLSPYRIYSRTRINSRIVDASFAVRAVDEEDIAWVGGLPATKAERTLIDLCLDFEDPSLIGDALRDAARKGLDFDRLAFLISQKFGKGARNQLLSQLGEAAARIKGEENDVREATEPGRILFNVIPNGEAAERRWTHDGLDWE